MTINKYQGKTKEEAVEKAKQELGAGAVVLNVKVPSYSIPVNTAIRCSRRKNWMR